MNKYNYAVGVVTMFWSTYYFLIAPMYQLPIRIIRSQALRNEYYYMLAMGMLATLGFFSSANGLEKAFQFPINIEGLNGFWFFPLGVILAGHWFCGLAMCVALFYLLPYSYFVYGTTRNLPKRLIRPRLWFQHQRTPLEQWPWAWIERGVGDRLPPLKSVMLMLRVDIVNLLVRLLCIPFFILWMLRGVSQKICRINLLPDTEPWYPELTHHYPPWTE